MFDPYRKWLGIPPKDQPPHHYRLLGLELFESDPDIIEGAADRQMGFVRQYQSGEHAAEAARLLNELALARLCLLKSATKATYDAKLRLEQGPPELDFADLPAGTDERITRRGSPKRKKKSSVPLILGLPRPILVGGSVSAVIVAMLIVFLGSGRARPPAVVPAPPDSAPERIAAKPDAEQVKPDSIVSTDPTGSNSAIWSEPKLMTEPAGQAVDLLKLVDLNRDAIAGEWQKTTTALIGGVKGRLYLPVKTPENYQLTYVVRPLEGGDILMLGFMMAGRQGMIAVGGWNSTISGLYVDGREPTDNCTTRHGKLFTSGSATIVLTVHPGHLHVTFDKQTIIDWHGDPERLYLLSALQMGCRESPLIGLGECKYVIESASLTPIKPQPKRIARLDREIDVISLFDFDRDAFQGVWGLHKNALYSPEGIGRILLPVMVPEEYTVSALVELPADNRGEPTIIIEIPSPGAQSQIVIKNDECVGIALDEDYGQLAGIDLLDGKRNFDAANLTLRRYNEPLLPQKKQRPAKLSA